RSAIDVGDRRFALDIEAQDAMLEGVYDLFLRFAHASEGALSGISAGREHAKEFAAGNDVEPGAFLREQTEDRAIGVRFDRIANEVIDIAERRIEPAVMIEDRARAVNIERRPIFFRDAFEGHAFARDIAVVVA